MHACTTRAAFAVAAQLAAAAACAQSTVTLYGRLELSADYVRIKSRSGAARIERGISSDASRFGLRGSEDLGGGLRATFVLEQGFDAATGSLGGGGRVWGRGSYVGLAGDFGEVRLGVNNIPLDDIAWRIDPFYYSWVAPLWLMTPYQSRIDNSIKYISPLLGAVQLKALVSEAGDNGDRFVGFSATYVDKGLEVNSGYTIHKHAVPAGDRKTRVLGAAYRFAGEPSLKLSSGYFDSHDAGDAALRTVMVGGQLRSKHLAGFAGMSYAVQRHGAATARRIGVLYWYPLSRRTAVQAGFAIIDNGEGARVTVNPAFPRVAAGEDVRAVTMSFRSDF